MCVGCGSTSFRSAFTSMPGLRHAAVCWCAALATSARPPRWRPLRIGQGGGRSARPRNISSKYGLSAWYPAAKPAPPGAGMRGPSSTVKNGLTSTPLGAPSSRSTPRCAASTAGMAAPRGAEVLVARGAAQPGQHLAHRVGMLGGRIARRDNAVGDADPARRAGRQHRHAPAERGLVGDRAPGCRCRTGTAPSGPARNWLREKSPLSLVSDARRRDVVVVDQADQVVESLRSACGLSNANRSPSEKTPPAEPM